MAMSNPAPKVPEDPIMQKFTDEQVDNIIKKTVPLLTGPENYGVFEFLIREVAESSRNSTEFTLFIEKLLKERYVD